MLHPLNSIITFAVALMKKLVVNLGCLWVVPLLAFVLVPIYLQSELPNTHDRRRLFVVTRLL